MGIYSEGKHASVTQQQYVVTLCLINCSLDVMNYDRFPPQ